MRPFVPVQDCTDLYKIISGHDFVVHGKFNTSSTSFRQFHKTASAYASSYRQKYHDSFPLILGENLVFTVVDSQDARIDVDSVQLPWSLRVEYVPNVILFPRNRKSYSAVLPAAAISSSDLYNNLIAFVLERLKSAPPNDRGKYRSFVGIPSGYQNRNNSRIAYTADTYLATVRQHCTLHNSSRACMDYFASGPLENHARQIESSRSLLCLLMRRLETGLTEVSHALAPPDDGLALLDRLTAAGRARVHRLQDVQHALSGLWRRLSGAEALFSHESELTASLRQRLLAV
nr:unnamed protein product [Spirometra erinaceieuropaei]